MTQLAKTCTKCGETKPLDDFYRQGSGHYASCKPCHKAIAAEWKARNPDKVARMSTEASRRRRYKALGITEEDFQRMCVEQDWRCAICLQKYEAKRLHVDHDHSTGVVRALLCNRCNLVIGKINDMPELADAIGKYLRAHA